MKTYSYRAQIEPGEIGEWVISFPDVPEAVSQAETREEARLAGQDALGLALLSYAARGRTLPERRYGPGGTPPADLAITDAEVTAAPDVTAKLALLEIFATSGCSADELATALGRDAAYVHCLLDPMHQSDIQDLSLALEVLGRRLIAGVAGIDEAA